MKWICYQADMPLNHGDMVMLRESETICTGRFVCEGSPVEIVIDFGVGLDMYAFYHKRDILMVQRGGAV